MLYSLLNDTIGLEVMKLIIQSSHFFIMQNKIINIKTNNIPFKDILIKDNFGKQFAVINNQTVNNQAAIEQSTIDPDKERDLLMRMLAFNSNPQIITTSENSVTVNKDSQKSDNRREQVMSETSSPVNLTATEEKSQVILFWDPVSAALGYNVKRSTASGGPYTIVANNIIGNSYADHTVKPGVTYYYVVTSLNEYGESKNSKEVFVTLK